MHGAVYGDERFQNPVPDTISPEARALLAGLADPATYPGFPDARDLEGWRAVRANEATRTEPKVEAVLKQYEPSVTARDFGGVPVLDIKPKGWSDDPRVILFLHGGGYALGSARVSLPASVPLAHDAGLRLISVDYTTIPFVTYDTILEQIVTVVRGLLAEGRSMDNIALAGVSAGGGLAAGVILKMRDQRLGLPGALVPWSPATDVVIRGDTSLTLRHFEPAFDYRTVGQLLDMVVPPERQRDPYVSPVYGDYARGYVPTLIQGGTREVLLSGFVRLYQAMDQARVPVKLDLYEGMVHTFQEVAPNLPESRIAREKSARFMLDRLRR